MLAHNDGQYPILDCNAENEHFEISESVISWMELQKADEIELSEDQDVLKQRKNSNNEKSEIKEVVGSAEETTNTSTSNNTTIANKQPGTDTDRVVVVDQHEQEYEKDQFVTTDKNKQHDSLRNFLQPSSSHHQLSATSLAYTLIRIYSEKRGLLITNNNVSSSSSSSSTLLSSRSPPIATSAKQNTDSLDNSGLDDSISRKCSPLPSINQFQHQQSQIYSSLNATSSDQLLQQISFYDDTQTDQVRMRGNNEWAPPRAQIIFIVHEETNLRKLLLKQNYLCAGCGTKIDLELARRLVLFCHYLGKYFCKCCFSHKAIHLPGYIIQKWDFHKYPVSHFALQLLDRMANEPLFNINDINNTLYSKVKKLRHLIEIRMQLYYLNMYITTCSESEPLSSEFGTFSQKHLLQDDVHLYSLNNLIEIQHGKLYEYLNDLVSRSIAHIAQCDECRSKGDLRLQKQQLSSSGSDSNVASLYTSGAVGEAEGSPRVGQETGAGAALNKGSCSVI